MVRGEYTLMACDYCGIQLHKNELLPVTDKVKSGERRGSRTYFSTKGTVGGGSSRSDYYRTEHNRICGPCYDARAARMRQERIATLRGYLLLAAIVVGVLAYLNSSKSPPETAAAPTSNMLEPAALNSSDTAPTPDDNAVSPAEPNTAAHEPGESIATPTSVSDAADEVSADRAVPPTMRFADNEVSESIKAVTPDALESERPQMWHAGKLKGYVVPSAPQVYDGQTCSNVYATTIYGDQQSRSATVRWCKPADGEWKLSQP